MKSDDLMKKLGHLTLADARTCIFGHNIHMEPGT
mgnify:CR=1 FL=1